MALVAYMQKYFWDIDPRKARPRLKATYYIKRVLELGDAQAIQWLRRVYGIKRIKQVLAHSQLSPRSRNFWRQML